MARYEVELLPAAFSDLDEIFDYILMENPQAAEEMLAFYRFLDNKVLVYRILHGARSYSHLLKDTIK